MGAVLIVGWRILVRTIVSDGLGLRTEGKLQWVPLGPGLLDLGVQSLLLSWKKNDLRSVVLHGVLPQKSHLVKIWGVHADLHG